MHLVSLLQGTLSMPVVSRSVIPVLSVETPEYWAPDEDAGSHAAASLPQGCVIVSEKPETWIGFRLSSTSEIFLAAPRVPAYWYTSPAGWCGIPPTVYIVAPLTVKEVI